MLKINTGTRINSGYKYISDTVERTSIANNYMVMGHL